MATAADTSPQQRSSASSTRSRWRVLKSILSYVTTLRGCWADDSQLQEFGSKYESETLRNSKKLDQADVIIYVHDSSDTNSFSYISNLRVRWGGLVGSLLTLYSNNTLWIIFRHSLLLPNRIWTLRNK